MNPLYQIVLIVAFVVLAMTTRLTFVDPAFTGITRTVLVVIQFIILILLFLSLVAVTLS